MIANRVQPLLTLRIGLIDGMEWIFLHITAIYS